MLFRSNVLRREPMCSFVVSMMGEIIVRGSYGIDVQEKNDPYIANAERVVCIANETIIPGKWLVDVLPICTCTSAFIRCAFWLTYAK